MLSPAAHPPRLPTLIFITALSVMSLNMFLPSLTAMADAFGVSYSQMSGAISFYLAVTAVLQLFMGALSDKYGRRPLLLVGLVMFFIASVGCALAQDHGMFLFWRMMQGGIIAGSVITRAVVRDVAPPKEAASMIGTIGMVMALAPMLAPILGGVLDTAFGWRANFWAFALFGLIALWMCWSDLGETNTRPSPTFMHQFRAYPELLRSGLFWAYSLTIAFSTGVFFAFLGGAPFVATVVFDLDASSLGFALATTPMGFVLGNYLSRIWTPRTTLQRMVLVGRIVTFSGLVLSLAWLLLIGPSVWVYFGMMGFVGLGNGLTIPSASVGAMSVKPELAGSASGLSGAMMVGGGAVMTALGGWLLSPQNAALSLLLTLVALALAGLDAAWTVHRLSP